MPTPDLTPPTPANCIGYGCVVVPELDEFQGFFIIDDKALWSQANLAMTTAMLTGVSPIGALQASLVEMVLLKDWGRAGVMALALSSLTKHKFFWIKASKEPGGTRSEMFPLASTTVEQARAEIDALPEVVDLKRRLVEAMRQPKQ